jgi:hypothetical protein
MAFRLRNFHAAVQGASGPEFEVMDYLQTTSSPAFERVLSLNFTLRVCRSIHAQPTESKPTQVAKGQEGLSGEESKQEKT